MPIQLQSDAYDIAYDAMNELFCGEPDEYGLCDVFADRWSTDFSTAITNYIMTCTGLPVGGPVVPGPPVTLTLDIYNAMKNALTDTFMGEPDDDNLADKFGAATASVGPAIASYMPSCTTIVGPGPTFISPGGPVTAPPSSQLVPIFFAAAKAAWIAAFKDAPDDNNIAEKFANVFKDTGDLISDFVGRCMSPPSGGPLIVMGAVAPSSHVADIQSNTQRAQAAKELAEQQAEAAEAAEDEKFKAQEEIENKKQEEKNKAYKEQMKAKAEAAKQKSSKDKKDTQ